LIGLLAGEQFRETEGAAVDDLTNVEVAFRKWVKQLRAVENLIPSAVGAAPSRLASPGLRIRCGRTSGVQRR
jgi:hypothetical protein